MSDHPYSSDLPSHERDDALISPPGRLAQLWEHLLALFTPEYWRNAGKYQLGAAAIVLVLLVLWLVSWYWSCEPGIFEVRESPAGVATEGVTPDSPVRPHGYIAVRTVQRMAQILRDKPGGYLANDWLPPGVLLDNMPNWERGVLEQIEDFLSIMHQNWVGLGDDDIETAWESFTKDSWFASAESRQAEGITALGAYLVRLSATPKPDAHFQAQKLHLWLERVAQRLTYLTRELGSSVVGAYDLDNPQQEPQTTAWLEVDNVFYHARGSAWALLHLLRAVQIDFHVELKQHQLDARMEELIRVLARTQKGVWSPMILNGYEFGLFANHSLVMASYLGRAAQDVEAMQEALRKP